MLYDMLMENPGGVVVDRDRHFYAIQMNLWQSLPAEWCTFEELEQNPEHCELFLGSLACAALDNPGMLQPGELDLAECRQEYFNTTLRSYVARNAAGAVIGGAQLSYAANQSVAKIYALHRNDAVKGQGVGARLLMHLLDEARTLGNVTRVTLDVMPYNTKATTLYTYAGFVTNQPNVRFGKPMFMYLDGAERIDKAIQLLRVKLQIQWSHTPS